MLNAFLQVDVDELSQKTTTLIDKFESYAVSYVPKLIGAVLIYWIGSMLIRKLMRLLEKALGNRKFDPSMNSFVLSLVRVTLTIILFLSIAGLIGVNVTSFAALLAGAGLAIGSALNGSLGNIAGGVMIMIFKPFKVGDVIEAQGHSGKVQEMGIFSTIILTGENKTVILPNGALSTGVISNFNTAGYVRVSVSVTLDGSNDMDKVRAVCLEAVRAVPEVMDAPEPSVLLSGLDGGLKVVVAVSSLQADIAAVTTSVNEMLKKAFEANGITGPVSSMVIKNG